MTKQRDMTAQSLHLRRLIASAIFLAISLVLRATASGYIPLFGIQGQRIGIHGAFSILPAILFGPWYGAVVSGLSDVLGHFTNPTPTGGPWLWQITLVATLGGFVRGWAWRLLKNRSTQGTRGVIIGLTLIFLAFGSFGFVQLRQEGITRYFYDNIEDPSTVDTTDMNFIGRLLITRTQNTQRPPVQLAYRINETVYAPIAAGVLGLLLLVVDLVLSKKLEKDNHFRIMPLAITIILVSLGINTANSVILWSFAAPAWGAFPFMYIWLPRALISLLNSIVNVFVVALLLGVCFRHRNIRAWVEWW